MSDTNLVSLPNTMVTDLVSMAQDVARDVENALRKLTVDQGGWPSDKWIGRHGGTLVIMDADGNTVTSQSVLRPNKQWAQQTCELATEKAKRALETGRNSIATRNPGAGQYGGAILFEYKCAITGETCIGAIAFSGWPEWADHLVVNELAEFAEHITPAYETNKAQVVLAFPEHDRKVVHAAFVECAQAA